MVGSKASSIGVCNGRKSPKCWCNEFMKLWVSNTVENPKRKFWRCRNYWENENHCKLYIWDDELDSPRVRSLLQRIAEKNSEVEGCSSNIEIVSSNAKVWCKKCVLLSENLREFGKDIGKEIGIEFGKELGKEYGQETASDKHKKTKKKLQYERKKNAGMMIALVLSWMFFLVVFILM